MEAEYNHLNHATSECKYHVVFTPKYRKKLLFGKIKRHLGQVFTIWRDGMHVSRDREHVFVFRSKRVDRVKLLAWDGNGMVLVTKWLHQGRFTWPPIRGGVVHLSATQLAMLLDGLEWTRVSPKPVKQPAVVG